MLGRLGGLLSPAPVPGILHCIPDLLPGPRGGPPVLVVLPSFAQIRLRFDLDTDAPQDKLDQLLKLTERYCVVYQTIKSGPPVEVTMARG